MTTATLIEKAKRSGGFASDYALSKAIGVRQNYITQWKSGRSLPDIQNFAKLAAAANISMDEAYEELAKDLPDLYIMRSCYY